MQNQLGFKVFVRSVSESVKLNYSCTWPWIQHIHASTPLQLTSAVRAKPAAQRFSSGAATFLVKLICKPDKLSMNNCRFNGLTHVFITLTHKVRIYAGCFPFFEIPL